MQKARVLILDGQGGGVGKSIISALLRLGVKAELIGAGTNAYACEGMKKAGADISLCGEDGIVTAARRADVICGPIGVIIPGALKGEITDKIAYAVAESKAVKVLVPINRCNIIVAGAGGNTLADNIEEVAKTVKERVSDM